MKKLLASLLIVILCFCAVCTNSSASNNILMTSLEFPVQCKNIEEYNALLKREDLPDNFVTYEALSWIGDFDHLTGFNYELNKYYYLLTESNGHQIHINFNHLPAEWYCKDQIIENVAYTDSAIQLATETYGAIIRNEFRYCYYNSGRLFAIQWKLGETMCSISVDQDDLVDGEGTFMNLLLSTSDEDVDKAMEMFKKGLSDANIDLESQTRTPFWHHLVIGAGVIAAAAGVIYIGIQCRKRYLRRKYAAFDIDI